MTLTGAVYGLYVIPASAADKCPTSNQAAIRNQAIARGDAWVTTTDIHLMYIIPNGLVCPSQTGLGRLIAQSTPEKAVHELGHSFGFQHSSAWHDSPGIHAHDEYGDKEVMGGYHPNRINAAQRDLMGYYNRPNLPSLQVVTTSGTYAIQPHEHSGRGVGALKVPTVSGIPYYVEQRTQGPWLIGVSLRRGPEQGHTHLVDLDPLTTADDYVLDVGQTYLDAAAKLSFTTRSTSASGATVEIVFHP
jgi:hypothetical protein